MKKIAISTFCYADNYGAMLQMYALYKFLDKKYDTEILNYDNKSISNVYKVIRSPQKNILKDLFHLFEDVINIKNNSIRHSKFNKFRIENFKFSNKVLDKEKINNSYNVIICGSDQIWNPKLTNGFDDIYYLNYNTMAKKIAYAASCGSVNNVKNFKDIFNEKINSINSISVRESDLKDFINTNCKVNADVCLDPTLLLSEEDWLKTIGNKKLLDGEYIFAYSVGNDNDNYYNAINYYQKKLNIPVIYFDKKTKTKKIKGRKSSYYTSDPFEFLNLLYYSKMVITTSFHGTVFSILFKKDFIITLSSDSNRITNLCNKLNISDHIITNSNMIENEKHKENNWKTVICNLNEEKEKSIKWLNNAIER